MKTVGLVGVGVMGRPMARNLVKGGYQVRAYDISQSAVDAIANEGATPASSPSDTTLDADFVITMLPKGSNVFDAVFGADGIADEIREDALYIDMSTILPADTDEIGRRLAERGIAMVDAPVGRTSQHAIEGTLLIMIGGSDENVARANPLLNLLGDTIVHCGPLGSGSRTKVVNNYLSVSLDVLTAEALTLAEACGLGLDTVAEVMRGTVAGQGHLSTTYPAQVLKGNLKPGFMINHADKDLGIALELALSVNAPTALGTAARQVFSVAKAEGRGQQDWTAVFQTVRTLAGLQ